jgi:two-component system capsular synthesis sensor histidine kinase RcsC
MQKILDRTQESLAHAFASLAQSAKHQQRLYLATIGSLMLIVVIFTLLLAVLAGVKQLDYRRAFTTQNAADIAALLHREQAFLARAELTLAYYDDFDGELPLPEGMADSVQKSGAVRSLVETDGAHIDLLVGDATRAAWGPQLNTKLWRLYQTGVSTLATEQAFALRQRAMLIGLNEDYAVMLPAADAPGAASGSDALLLQPAAIGTLRDGIERQLQAKTGKRVPGKGERLWLGPYREPLQGVPVITAVSAYYSGDTPVTLITTSIPVSTLPDYFTRPAVEGTLLIMTPDHRVIVSSPPVDAGTSQLLRNVVANMPADGYRYTRHGAVLVEPLAPGFGSLVGYLSWRALVGALRWQLAALAGLAVLVLGSVALTARLWGLRLLHKTFAETTRALESETLNHILVSATPIGLCIVRQSDFSILTANALAGELLHIEAGANRLPPHIVGEFSAQAPDKPSVTAFAKVAAFVAPARPVPSQSHLSQAVTQALPDANADEAMPAQFLQFTYAAARYADEDVCNCGSRSRVPRA